QRFTSRVYRRYNDFVSFHELLLCRFPYRLIPNLPPKKIGVVFSVDAQFLENRRKGLLRWLTFFSRHPVISNDALFHFFLTQTVPDLHLKIKEVFKNVPDEFSTSEMAAKAKEFVLPNTPNEFAASREQIRVIQSGVGKVKQIADLFAIRSRSYAADMAELGVQLCELSAEDGGNSVWATGGNDTWARTKKGLGIISKEFPLLSRKALEQALKEENEVCEKLTMLLEVLNGHQELCERVEKGVSHDHQSALSKMLSLKKRQIQDVLRGTDAESIAVLENRMLQQESVIASVELRTAFSFYCVRMETHLVHTYLETLAQVFNSLVSVQITTHKEVRKSYFSSLIDCTSLSSIQNFNHFGSETSKSFCSQL
ncbi:hypothetical protein AAG570_012002, partial [Ranatra chinensis]